MTEAEFIQIHNYSVAGNINSPLQINVNIEDTIVGEQWNVITSDTGFITGITVTTNAKYVDDAYNQSIREVLQQVEGIRFFFNSSEYTLEVLNRSFYNNNDPETQEGTSSPQGFSFFYFKVQPFELPANTYDDPEVQQNVVVNFTPFITDLEFAFNDYNVLINNATTIRRSEVVVESDRNEGQNVPNNFNPIYSGSALNAAIQDSYYSSLSWRNSRYDGAKSTPGNYAGVTPSLAGRSFSGEIFPQDALSDVVCLSPTSPRVLEEFFHNGPNNLPTFETYNTSAVVAAGGIGASQEDTTLAINTQINPLTGSLDTGDILIVAPGELQEEKMRVVKYLPNLTPSPTVIVQRGYLGTSVSAHGPNKQIYKVTRTDLYRFGTTDTKIASAANAIIYVEDLNSSLYTDDFGTVYSGSACPEPLLLGVDNPNPQ